MTDTKGKVDIDKESADSTAPKSTAVADDSETAQGPRRSQRKGVCYFFYSQKEKKNITTVFFL